MMGKLDQKVAIVTGAAQGIGRQIALKLCGDGAAAVINDLDADGLNETLSLIEGAGGGALAHPGDVTADGFAEDLVDRAVNDLGGLHIIVNNAGYIWNGAAHNHSDEQFEAMLDVHVMAPFRILRAFSGWMRAQAKQEIAETGKARCRKIVNISSVSGTAGSATQIGYSAAKSAVLGMTKTLAKEWGRYKVNVNCVAFGMIDTRLTQASDEKRSIVIDGNEVAVGIPEKVVAGFRSMIPLGRTGTVEEAAGGVYLFCLPESNYVSGQTLTVGGGLAF